MANDIDQIKNLQDKLEVLNRFPEQNPNPVLRISNEGTLLYMNSASEEISKHLNMEVGKTVPDAMLVPVQQSVQLAKTQTEQLEIGSKTYSFNLVPVPEFEFVNIYGTNITASKLLQKFPEQNPNPVLKASYSGELIFANNASQPIIEAWNIEPGKKFPGMMLEFLSRSISEQGILRAEIEANAKTYSLSIVPVPEFEFINIYGTDITAAKVIKKFPEQNPNPVLKVSTACELIYANAAAGFITAAWGINEGDKLPVGVEDSFIKALKYSDEEPVELKVMDKYFSFRVVLVREFDFINIYGTDITASKDLELANKENERLLLNILPVSIAERLKKGEEVIADKIENITILFADLVGFTTLSTELPPQEVVELLNSVFSGFDRLLSDFSLEKIKTIGDAYMVAGGLDDEEESTALVAKMALAMLEQMDQHNEKIARPVQLRIGIHTGPVIAGVIGLRKFVYDIWGDSVNTASRMESHGVPGKIQCSKDTYLLLKEEFLFSKRGEIEIKGKGNLETYFLEGLK